MRKYKLTRLCINKEEFDKLKSVEIEGKSYVFLTQFVNEEEDKFGKISSVYAEQSKEIRDSGAPKIKVGSSKLIKPKNSSIPKSEPKTQQSNANDDLPF